MMGELLIIRQCCNEDCKDSVFGRFECYFSLERKVTKSSRLHLSRYSASFVRCRLWTRFAQTAQPPGALYGCFALRSPDEPFHRTLNVLLWLPILPVKAESTCYKIQVSVSAILRGSRASWERPKRVSVREGERRSDRSICCLSVASSDATAESFSVAVKPVKPWSFDYFWIKPKVGSKLSITTLFLRPTNLYILQCR